MDSKNVRGLVETKTFSTNRELLTTLGLLQSKKGSILRSIFSLSLITSGIFHYILKVVITYDDLELLTVIKVMHLTCIYFSSSLSAWMVLFKSKNFHAIHSTIKRGFYDYPERLTDQQLAIREEADYRIKRISKYGPWFFIVGTLGSALKEPVPYDFDVWMKEYNGWIPFKVDSWSKYFVSQTYHLMTALSAALLGGSVCIVFITIAEHLLAQLSILCISLRSAVQTVSLAGDIKVEHVTYERIKRCIEHHQAILSYYSVPLLSIMGGTAIAMCTMAFVVTDPESTFGVSIAFLSLFAPEICFCFCYCTYGQKINDMGNTLRDTVYFSPWYLHTVKVQKVLKTMLIRTQKPLVLSAAGFKNCSYKSFGEVIQATYTYFNMLNVFRRKK